MTKTKSIPVHNLPVAAECYVNINALLKDGYELESVKPQMGSYNSYIVMTFKEKEK